MMQLRLTPAVKAICIASLALFLWDHVVDPLLGMELTRWLGLVPMAVLSELFVWQVFTYSFLHADALHLFLNLMMLVFIGGEIEATWGTRRFLKYYSTCVGVGGLLYLVLQVFVKSEAGIYTPMVGASAGIYGLLMAYGILFGERVLLFMMLFPMKAKLFVWVLAGLEFFSGISGRGSWLSNAAHLGGMLTGLVYLWGATRWSIYRKQRAALGDLRDRLGLKNSKKFKKINHLKLVVDNPKDDSKPKSGSGSGEPPTWH